MTPSLSRAAGDESVLVKGAWAALRPAWSKEAPRVKKKKGKKRIRKDQSTPSTDSAANVRPNRCHSGMRGRLPNAPEAGWYTDWNNPVPQVPWKIRSRRQPSRRGSPLP
jgi:hypothetical protein